MHPDLVLRATWIGATLVHVILCARWARSAGPERDLDAVVFRAALLAWALLSAALHVAATTTGVSLASALLVLGLAHVVAWMLTRGQVDRPDGAESSGAPNRAGVPAVRPQGTATIGLALLTALTVAWIGSAAESIQVGGTDAAHYHVPHAVNLALGSPLFAPSATPHLYPMGTSALLAWFLLPVGDAFLIELAMVPPLWVLAGSLAWLFRQATGQSGLTWTPWLLLWLCSMPLFGASALPSADLPFAASTLAVVALALSIACADEVRADALVLLSLAAGLLLGTKTLAVPVLAAVVTLLGVVLLARRVASTRLWRAALLAVIAAVAAGGVWEIRNWVNYGSPVAPMGLRVAGIEIFPGDTYESMRMHSSVLSDVEEFGWAAVRTRVVGYVRAWLDPHYARVLLLILLVPLDLALARGAARGLGVRRAGLVVTLGLLAVVVPALLVGAPWTSLTWTHGFSLRYALPVLALAPLAALIGLFPLALPWYQHRFASPAVLALVALGASWRFAAPPVPPAYVSTMPLPAPGLVALAVGVLIVGGVVALQRARRKVRVLGALGLVPAISLLGATAMTARHARASAVTTTEEARSAHRGCLALMLEDERRAGRDCRRRRIFVGARFDVPLALQERPFGTLVYDARSPGLVRRALERRSVEPGCDYLIADESALEARTSAPLLNLVRLHYDVRALGTSGPFAVVGVGARH